MSEFTLTVGLLLYINIINNNNYNNLLLMNNFFIAFHPMQSFIYESVNYLCYKISKK
jgi:hypothetical protein